MAKLVVGAISSGSSLLQQRKLQIPHSQGLQSAPQLGRNGRGGGYDKPSSLQIALLHHLPLSPRTPPVIHPDVVVVAIPLFPLYCMWKETISIAE